MTKPDGDTKRQNSRDSEDSKEEDAVMIYNETDKWDKRSHAI